MRQFIVQFLNFLVLRDVKLSHFFSLFLCLIFYNLYDKSQFPRPKSRKYAWCNSSALSRLEM